MPVNDWKGKSMVIFGDSIQWQDGKPYGQGDIGAIAVGMGTIIQRKLGFSEYDNQGVSGVPMAEGTVNGEGTHQAILDYLSFSDKDLVIIAAGTNDFKLNVPIGELGGIGNPSVDPLTFYGAYHEAVEHILTVKPTIRIVLCTPLQRDNNGYDVNHKNASGHKLIDYVKAIQFIGDMYGLPICDLYRNSGITELTFSTFLMDGLHPNDLGYQRMGGYTSGIIQSIGV
ncbi:SGNH/GDSL hydrolase family protein [Alkalihalobacillus sp. TS-13]|uniref:SGNH/GDSL hydrolase family protein n=1 Tax=Alkalihalobacillus sp. TS-13 TaxID=2842455 RepID=UPI001C86DC5F|nr:SGNH/GDSL hydrolase family protein [Alkalihalobacillus sp. TS-13]